MSRRCQFVVRLLTATALGILVAVAVGREVSDAFVGRVLLEHGAKELTDVPEYQGIGFTAILYGVISGGFAGALIFLVSMTAARLLWRPSET